MGGTIDCSPRYVYHLINVDRLVLTDQFTHAQLHTHTHTHIHTRTLKSCHHRFGIVCDTKNYTNIIGT